MATPIKSFYTAALTWMIIGLGSGLFYREFTRSGGVDGGSTQLATLHTHLLVLGVVFNLIFLLLQRSFALSEHKFFAAFFWTWQAGVGVTTVMMLVKGIMQVLGNPAADHAAIAGISGLGHITITVAVVFFFIALKARINAVEA